MQKVVATLFLFAMRKMLIVDKNANCGSTARTFRHKIIGHCYQIKLVYLIIVNMQDHQFGLVCCIDQCSRDLPPHMHPRNDACLITTCACSIVAAKCMLSVRCPYKLVRGSLTQPLIIGKGQGGGWSQAMPGYDIPAYTYTHAHQQVENCLLASNEDQWRQEVLLLEIWGASAPPSTHLSTAMWSTTIYAHSQNSDNKGQQVNRGTNPLH